METSENKKTLEELADAALEKVAGGGMFSVLGVCPGCQKEKELGLYCDPASPNPFASVTRICADCARDFKYESVMIY